MNCIIRTEFYPFVWSSRLSLENYFPTSMSCLFPTFPPLFFGSLTFFIFSPPLSALPLYYPLTPSRLSFFPSPRCQPPIPPSNFHFPSPFFFVRDLSRISKNQTKRKGRKRKRKCDSLTLPFLTFSTYGIGFFFFFLNTFIVISI